MGPFHPSSAFARPWHVESIRMFARGLLESAVRALAFEGTEGWLRSVSERLY